MYRAFPSLRENFPPGSPGLTVIAGDALERLLTVRQVAEVLGCSTATVYKLCARTQLAHLRVNNAVRVRPTDLRAFVAERAHRGAR